MCAIGVASDDYPGGIQVVMQGRAFPQELGGKYDVGVLEVLYGRPSVAQRYG